MFVEYYKGMIDAYRNVQDWIDIDESVEVLKSLLDEEIEEIKEEQNL